MWGIQLGRVDAFPIVKGFLDTDDDDNNATATTEACTTVEGDMSDSDLDDEDDSGDFAMENVPRPPQVELMYRGKGTSVSFTRENTLSSASQATPAKERGKEAREAEADGADEAGKTPQKRLQGEYPRGSVPLRRQLLYVPARIQAESLIT